MISLIRKAHREHGLSPTLHELATAMAITFQSVAEHIKALEQKGMIVRHGIRGLTLIEANLSCAQPVPVYAGEPGLSPPVAIVWLEAGLAEADDYMFGFLLGDDTGGEDGLRQGDYVFARPGTLSEGDLAAVVLGGQMTVRRAHYTVDAVVLQPGGLRVPLGELPSTWTYGRVVAIHRVFPE